MDHINSWCNVDHTKESNAEAFRISKSEPSTPYRKNNVSRSFPMIIFFGIYNLESMCYPNYIFRTASEAFGWWSAPQRKRFSIVLGGGQVKKTCFTTFLDCINGFKQFFGPSLPINNLPNHTILSHHLLLFRPQPWFSIVGLS